LSIPTLWLIFASMGVALMLGGGIYESVVISPQWRANPPASFRIIQQSTGVPLQRFWIPVHTAITVLMVGAITSNWRYSQRRDLLLIAAGSYIVMRLWSAVYFIPEMLRFQKVPLESAATPELLSRVTRWTTLTWLREPLDIITQVCLLVALSRWVV
jgi:hypothetical protein